MLSTKAVDQLKQAVFPAVLAAFVVAGCASQPAPSQVSPGFAIGFLNGLVAPFAFIGSLFSNEVRIYAFPNSGVWYDFGFLLGLGCWAGGGGAAASTIGKAE
jgi:hypothetical protein